VFFLTGTGSFLGSSGQGRPALSAKIRLLGGTNLFRLRELPHGKNTRQLHYYFINKEVVSAF
jgi:hypothetical protein